MQYDDNTYIQGLLVTESAFFWPIKNNLANFSFKKYVKSFSLSIIIKYASMMVLKFLLHSGTVIVAFWNVSPTQYIYLYILYVIHTHIAKWLCICSGFVYCESLFISGKLSLKWWRHHNHWEVRYGSCLCQVLQS